MLDREACREEREIMSQKVSVTEAAKEIGCCKEYLYRQMRSGDWKLGKVVKPSKGKKYYRYLIFRDKLNEFLKE